MGKTSSVLFAFDKGNMPQINYSRGFIQFLFKAKSLAVKFWKILSKVETPWQKLIIFFFELIKFIENFTNVLFWNLWKHLKASDFKQTFLIRTVFFLGVIWIYMYAINFLNLKTFELFCSQHTILINLFLLSYFIHSLTSLEWSLLIYFIMFNVVILENNGTFQLIFISPMENVNFKIMKCNELNTWTKKVYAWKIY